MPTPSSDAPPSGSPRFFTFSSCPDPEDTPPVGTPSQPARVEPAASPESHSSPSWRRPLSPPAYSTEAAARTGDLAGVVTNTSDSRSATLSPGPRAEGDGDGRAGRDVDMEPEQESDGVLLMRRGADNGDRHKPADLDKEMSPAGEESGGGSPVGGRGQEVTKTRRGGSPGRRKSRTKEPFSPAAGEIHDVDAWGPVVGAGPRWVEDSGLVGLGLEYSHMRVIPMPTSVYLQPGSRFVGAQQSERQRYNVEVEIKYVDMRDSFLCGYLKIQGLTHEHPTLTTYFEGEIIGTKYGFMTREQEWGATEKIDLSHWSKFPAFRPYLKQARKGVQTIIKDVEQREHIFMRWKELFLVPDHRVTTLNGASFEGFYYICFNQLRGEVSGIYFHNKSEN
ncbi:424eb942-3c67-4b81-9433-9375e9c2fa0d [Thermothielavioides terrestris]|uniref:424eb942-3c67-4b81-9433-9375e9c2fa0d n=1 Tax=Thermothielavioides terrestris TaxID=2587410 RepID=A0A446BCE2_9PEZI|nr:424eb942-3c67-4b81-9433-9375e9c2fa0d [Thermothielavioides terrestris]